ncbi:hypothetical protein [Clostridium thailandense]|uniref:Uncharacterized protein n=1 Tax=Clostridium thailandense TaxID=2794346 RepID=A0A949TQA6_9CLOT|nr:hypothetical protein [Clostridium thailandense]MBV7276570.1 hypothetical protein [Clostridium thailandense]MCH5137577.1 hypothetical protein [Clostridiaceae bacterium UIB06]
MYDAKVQNSVLDNYDSIDSNNSMRCDCIGDRSYFKQVQYESMFEFKSMHIPIENVIK